MPVSAVALKIKQLLTPTAPAAGSNALYPKTDNNWYGQDSTGAETLEGQEFPMLAPVRVSSGTNALTLSGLQTVDGVALAAGDRVLVRWNSPSSQNGVYLAASGAWSRAPDANTAAKLASGTQVAVLEGTLDKRKVFTQLLAVTTIDTDGQEWRVLNYADAGGAFTFPRPMGDGQLYHNRNQHTLTSWTGAAWEDLTGRVICTSTTRPTFVGAGMTIFETDTANSYIFHGGIWKPWGGADSGSMLALVRATDQFVNVTLSGLGTAVDGVTLVDGDRVLLKHQTTAAENDIWIAHSGAWTRDPVAKIRGTAVRVLEGTQNRYKTFTQVDPSATTQNWRVVTQVDYGLAFETPPPQSEGHLFYNWVDRTLRVWAGAWVDIGAVVICTSTTRPAAAYDGKMIYETDTGSSYVSQGGTWKSLGGGGGAVGGGTGFAAVGSIVAWGGTTAPSGWLICDGTAVSRTTYADLFAAIGTTYGVGDGSSTFNVPNLKDRFPMGVGARFPTLGAGADTYNHQHAVTLNNHYHTISHAHQTGIRNAGNAMQPTAGGGAFVSRDDHQHATGEPNNATSGWASDTGASSDVRDHTPPYQVVNYIIRATVVQSSDGLNWRSAGMPGNFQLTTAAQLVPFTADNGGAGMTTDGAGRFVAQRAGIYHVAPSVTIVQSGGATPTWVILDLIHRRGGTSVASRQVVTQGTSNGAFNEATVAQAFDARVGDTFEVMATAQANSLVQVDLRSQFTAHLLAGTSPVDNVAAGFRGVTGTPVVSGAWAVVDLTATADHNVGGVFSTSPPASVVTIGQAGVYQIEGSTQWDGFSATARCILRVEGWIGAAPGLGAGTIIAEDDIATASGQFPAMTCMTQMSLPAGYQLRLIAYQTSGVTRNVAGAGAAQPSKLNIHRVGSTGMSGGTSPEFTANSGSVASGAESAEILITHNLGSSNFIVKGHLEDGSWSHQFGWRVATRSATQVGIKFKNNGPNTGTAILRFRLEYDGGGGGSGTTVTGIQANLIGGWPTAAPGATSGTAISCPAGTLVLEFSATCYHPSGGTSQVDVYLDGGYVNSMSLTASTPTGVRYKLSSSTLSTQVSAGLHYIYFRQVTGTSDTNDRGTIFGYVLTQGSVGGGNITGSDTGWLPLPALQSGWTQYPSWEVAAYRKLNGIVYLKGLLAAGTVTPGTLMFTLPVGFRNSGGNSHTPVASGASTGGAVNIYNDGRVLTNYNLSGWCSLNNISYPADG